MDISALLLGILLGLLLGLLLGWLLAQHFFQQQRGISPKELETGYIPKAVLAETRQQLNQYHMEWQQHHQEVLKLRETLAARNEQVKYLQEKAEREQEKLLQMQQHLKMEFRNMANEILDEKSRKLLEINHTKLSDVLSPFSQKLHEFKGKVEHTYEKEVREVISLKEQIKQLNDLNQQLQGDAVKLTNALKGDVKAQGDWGEVQLEVILERAGLLQGVHYFKQAYYQDGSGGNFRPDYVVKLPEDKNLVIDSKVSLKAYNLYFNEEDIALQQKYLQEHLKSIQQHIKALAAKNYQQLTGLNQPDFILMFMPIEPALSLVATTDFTIFDKAIEKNILIVSPTTLLATLRTVAFIWKQENQKQNVLEIARESGALYDKFVNFLGDMEAISKHLDSATKAHHAAFNKLSESARKGDTVIGRIERIKKLGADASKAIPQRLLPKDGLADADSSDD